MKFVDHYEVDVVLFIIIMIIWKKDPLKCIAYGFNITLQQSMAF